MTAKDRDRLISGICGFVINGNADKPQRMLGKRNNPKEPKSWHGILYFSCNTNSEHNPGKIVYRASIEEDGKIEVILYTYWQKELAGLFGQEEVKRELGNDWKWVPVRVEPGMGVAKEVDSCEDAQKALRVLFTVFDRRLKQM